MTIAVADRARGRQYSLFATQEFDYTDFTATGTAVPVISLPAGARVVGGAIQVRTVWDSGSADDTIDVGDGVDPDRYTSTIIDADAAVSYTALTLDGYEYTTEDWIDITWTGTGTAATQGAGTLIVEYIIEDRANEVQPSAL